MKTSNIAKSALASLQATAAAGVFAAGMAVIPAEAAVDGFEIVPPEDIVAGCTHSQSHSQITCEPN